MAGITSTKKIKGQPHLLAYITPNEVEKLKALGGQETMTKEGIPAYPEYDNYGYSSQSDFDAGDRSKSNDPNVRGTAPGQNRVTAAQLAAINAKEKEAARIAKEKLDKRKAKNKNITKFGYNKPKSKLGGILGTIAGMMMGIPGLGLLTGGFDKLKGGLGSLNETLGDFREKTTGFRTQKEYEDARTQRQLQGRLDDMYAAKSKGKGFNQKNIDMIEAMGFQPSTAQNVLTGRDLKGFTPSRMGLQKQITPMAKPTFSDPFANTVGTTTKVNAPSNDAVSSVTRDYSGIQDYGVDINPQGSKSIFESLFPEGNLQDIIKNSKTQKDYNINATKDLVENLPGGVVKEAIAPALAGVLSPFYDGIQGIYRGATNPNKSILQALKDENIGSSMKERFTGAAAPLAERVANFNNPFTTNVSASETVPTTENITIDGGMLNSPFMENQIGPRVIAAENAYYNQGKMPPEFLGDRIRMNMELGNRRGFMGPGFAEGGIASMFTRRG